MKAAKDVFVFVAEAAYLGLKGRNSCATALTFLRGMQFLKQFDFLLYFS